MNSVNFFNNYPISYCASNDLQENGLVPQFYCVVVLKKDFEKTGSGRYLLGVYEIPPPYLEIKDFPLQSSLTGITESSAP